MLLEFVDVAKVYKGGLRGVDGVTMRLGPGLVGLLGPNGAGKSSPMRIAATVTRPTGGQVLLDGADVVARPDLLRRSLGYLPQDFGVYPHLTAREFLSYLAAVKGMPARAARGRIGELLELLDRTLPRGGTRPGWAFGRLLAGELRILVQGTSRWWWLVAAVVNVAGLAVPASLVKPAGASTALLLSAAWIWPVLTWSRLGAQRRENGLDTLLGAYPGAYRQLAAEWLAGLALTAATGLGPLLRMAVAADGPRVAAWIAGALFIPALALLLGTASRTHRLFQALYVMLWFAAVNQLAAADYMGTVLVHGRPAGPSSLLVAAVAAAMLAVTFSVRAAQHATR
jgi:hypothetical protein